MKQLIFIFVFSIYLNSCLADGVDNIKTYLNGYLIYNAKDFDTNSLTLTVQVGDTIDFLVLTDWGGEQNSIINAKTIEGIHPFCLFNSDKYYKDGAKFLFFLSDFMLNNKFIFTLNYNSDPKIEPWEFVKI